MSLYSKDKNYRFNVRLSGYQLSFLDRLRGEDKSLSEVFRMIIDSYMSGVGFDAYEQVNIDN